ncbi:MAG: magnesium transporter [Arenicella sp.]|nr:magnesium transporter [Arenicella sp.]
MNPQQIPTDTVIEHPGEVAHQLESLPQAERAELWASISVEDRGAAIPYLHDEIKAALLEEASLEELQDLTENMAAGDVADVLDLIDVDIAQDVVDNLSEEFQEQVRESLSFEDDQVGRWLRHDGYRYSAARTVRQVLDNIKRKGFPAYTDRVFVISRDDRYRGAIAMSSILEANDEVQLKELQLISNDHTFDPNANISDVTAEFRKVHFISAAVVDQQGFYLGRITAEDAATILQDSADHQLMSMAGLDEEDDLFSPVLSSAKRRALWLGINLLTALLASYVIGLFEDSVQQLVALAVLMPIVASMGGIAGSQTLTIVIRGIALGRLNSKNTRTLLLKELGVGVLNGILWASVVGALAFLWFDNLLLGVVIAAAILINLLAAALAGMIIPVVLERLDLDPALSGSVVLTTVTDVVGFMSFLGLATLLLL